MRVCLTSIMQFWLSINVNHQKGVYCEESSLDILDQDKANHCIADFILVLFIFNFKRPREKSHQDAEVPWEL